MEIGVRVRYVGKHGPAVVGWLAAWMAIPDGDGGHLDHCLAVVATDGGKIAWLREAEIALDDGPVDVELARRFAKYIAAGTAGKVHGWTAYHTQNLADLPPLQSAA